jgi:competence protein ComEA
MRVQSPEAVALLGLAAALGLAAYNVVRSHRPPEPVPLAAPPAATLISVHVAGEVVWPGLYVLKAGARVQDAIFAAHGPTVVADIKKVNLAAPLRDGDRVVVPRIVQPAYPFAAARGSSQPPRGAGQPDSSRAPPDPSPAGETPGMVNVNTATAADLERLPGVGPVLARRIVEFREAKGLFRRIEDLQEVQGIGPKLYRRLAHLIRLD